MKIAITGTTSGVGKALKDALSISYQVVSIDRLDFDFSDVKSLEKIDLTGVDILINNAGHSLGGDGHVETVSQCDQGTRAASSDPL